MRELERQWLVTEDGTLDYRGRPADKRRTGRWRATPSIFAAEFAERTAAFGVALNFVTFLVYEKHFRLTEAANMTTNVVGTSFLLTLVGGFMADTFLGRFWTIFGSATFQTMGLIVLLINTKLDRFNQCSGLQCPKAHGLDLSILYLGVYLVAIGSGGIKSSVSAFGADQFEKEDPFESKDLPAYFNWFFMAVTMGGIVGSTVIIWFENIDWAKGFGLLAGIMALSMFIMIGFRWLYRYKIPAGSPLTAVAKVIVAAYKNRNRSRPANIHGFYDEIRGGNHVRVPPTPSLRYLDKAAILPDGLIKKDQISEWDLATVTEVEDIKLIFRLLPVMATTWFFWTVDSQFTTYAVLQAITTNRNLGKHFVIPPASTNVFKEVTVLVTLLIYDRVFVPFARKITGKRAGITPLQRIGAGLVMSVLAMIVAALVEKHRLDVVHDLGLEKNPYAPLPNGPFSVFYLLPQFFFVGVGEALVYAGELDFFYNESPEHMQSLGTSMALCTLAIGFLASSAITTIVNSATGGEHNGWLRESLNASRLDYFYWALAVVSVLFFIAYLVASSCHQYKKTESDIGEDANGSLTDIKNQLQMDPNTRDSPKVQPIEG